MRASDFNIGDEFYFPDQDMLNRVTDVGSRTISYIRLDQEDERNYNGPPYSVVEHVLAEEEMGDVSIVGVSKDNEFVRVNYRIEGEITLPPGSVSDEHNPNLFHIPGKGVVSVHPVIEHSSDVDADDHKNLTDVSAGELGIYYGEYNRELFLNGRNFVNFKIQQALMSGQCHEAKDVAKYSFIPYTGMFKGERGYIHLLNKSDAIERAKQEAKRNDYQSVYVEDVSGVKVFDGPVFLRDT